MLLRREAQLGQIAFRYVTTGVLKGQGAREGVRVLTESTEICFVKKKCNNF